MDLTDGSASDAFLVDVFFNDMPATLSFTVYTNDGNDVAIGVLNLTPQLFEPLTATTLSLPFSSFTGPADFSDVGAIVVDITGDEGSDILLDNLRTGPAQINPAAPLPPPGVAPHMPPPSGALLIDGFEQGGAASSNSNPTVSSASFSATTSVADTLGGTRFIRVTGGAEEDPGQIPPGSQSTDYGFNIGDFDGVLFVASSPMLGEYTVELSYDGDSNFSFDPAGLGSVDLTDGGAKGAFLLGALFNDVPFAADFTVYSDGGTAMSTATLDVPGLLAAGGSLHLPFSAFVGDADFTDVSGLQFSFVSAFGQDLLIEYIAVVPEPASAALLALGGVAVFAYRRGFGFMVR